MPVLGEKRAVKLVESEAAVPAVAGTGAETEENAGGPER
jgi:hypothetical protein